MRAGKRDRPKGGPLGVWVAAVTADFVGERFVSDKVLEKFLCSGLVGHGGKEQEVHCHTVGRSLTAKPRCTATRPRCSQQPSRLNPALCTFFPPMIQQNSLRQHSDVHGLSIAREKITDDPEEWAIWVGHRKVDPTLLHRLSTRRS